MPALLKYAAAAIAATAPLVSAQTYTNCNPLDKSCPSDTGLAESKVSFDFTQSSALDKWTTTAGTVNTGSDGATFTINKKGDAPTIQSDFYLFYGEVAVTMKAAPGTGIVSSIVMESDDLDEIDWEALGGDTTTIETNYFGKGDTSSYDRATWPTVSTPQDTFHTYSVNWQKDKTTWSIDGNVVRTLNYADAQGGSRYPQTPMNIRIGIWAGGDSSNGEGTIEWAGGETDYSQAPFTMTIKSVEVTNANPAESYSYSDKSGSSDSIKLNGAGASSSSSTTSSTSSSSSTSSTSSSASSDSTSADSTSTASSTTVDAADSTSSGATTLITATQSSSAAKTTTPGGSATSSSAGASGSGSSSSGSTTGSGAGSSSSPGSGSGSSATGSSSASGSGSSSAPSATATFNAAATVAANYLGPLSFLALITAIIQL